MFDICDKKNCTGCGLCANLCPKKCISFQKNELGVYYPIIDKSKCISCHICKKNCPSNQRFNFNFPDKAYAGWSNSIKIRNQGASGGIAQELYKYALENNYSAYGVAFSKNVHEGLKYIKVKSYDDINFVCGSKYVQADLSDCLNDLNQDIKEDKKVLFIGVPCQCAAVKMKFDKMKKNDNLVLIDIVCHGVVPFDYLSQHIEKIEKKYKKKVKKITFRNPKSKYYFSLYDECNNLFYRKDPNQTDCYFRGYMNNLILRENCYHCRYANEGRITDITLADTSKINDKRLLESKDCEQVNLVLANSEKGQKILNYLKEKNKITLYEQPEVSQAIKYNKQLHSPSVKNIKRGIFEENYIKTSNFDISVNKSLRNELIKYKILFIPNFIKVKLLQLFPKKMKDKIKTKLNESR